METIKDLMLEGKTFVIEIQLTDDYYIFIEALDEYSCTINYSNRENFDIYKANFLMCEVHSTDTDNTDVVATYDIANINITIKQLREAIINNLVEELTELKYN